MNEDVKKAAGAKKTNLALMPPTAEDQCCKVLALGAAKYGEWNWRVSGVEAATYVAAIRRHINAIVRGEWYDHESQCSHFAHVMASAAIVLDADRIGLCKREVAPRPDIENAPMDLSSCEKINIATEASSRRGIEIAELVKNGCYYSHRGVGNGDSGLDDPPEVKAGLPKLPDGWAYYGLGPIRIRIYDDDHRDITGLMEDTDGAFRGWDQDGYWSGDCSETHYALRKGSEIAKLNGL